jgi:hypothetical protein
MHQSSPTAIFDTLEKEDEITDGLKAKPPISSSVILDFNDQDTENENLADQSIMLREGNIDGKTILDYRDFLDHSMERSRSTFVHATDFVVDQGLLALSDKEMHDLSRHNHSDLDSQDDEDPYFEYNMCHK